MGKIVYIAKERNGKVSIFSGTVEDLAESTFSYTLECGNICNPKIKKHPKTVSSLVSNLNKAVDETQGACYTRDYYYEISKEEAINNGYIIY